MTLNGHSALKSGSGSASNGLAFWLSEKTVRKFAELIYTLILSAAKIYPSVINVMGLFTGFLRRGSVKPVNCIHTSHTCCSLMSVQNK